MEVQLLHLTVGHSSREKHVSTYLGMYTLKKLYTNATATQSLILLHILFKTSRASFDTKPRVCVLLTAVVGSSQSMFDQAETHNDERPLDRDRAAKAFGS